MPLATDAFGKVKVLIRRFDVSGIRIKLVAPTRACKYAKVSLCYG